MTLAVHRAHAAEPLVAHLAAQLREPGTGRLPADPMAPVTVGVQSRGMERWLSHRLAEELSPDGAGIAANVELPFPGRLLQRLVEAAVGPAPDPDPWSPDRLAWTLLDVLDEHRARPELAPLERYLQRAGGSDPAPGDHDPAVPAIVDQRRWRLARRVADLLDRYALHRADLLRAWSADRDVDDDDLPLPDGERWQPLLWRALRSRLEAPDPVARLDRALDALHADAHAPERLPTSVQLFGISALPPRHLDLLVAAAERLPVELYVLTPSPAWWEALLARGAEVDDLAAHAQHPLLISCGRLIHDLAGTLHRAASSGARIDDRPIGPADDAAEEPAPGLLAALQRDLRDDRDRGAADDAPPAPIDDTVQLHACHGPARQVEVLRDALLGLLAEDPTLEPRDVLVMTPDIEGYAPLITAVFSGDDRHAPTLPARLADRSVAGTSPVADVLLALLDLADSRVAASDVLDLLSAGPVADRYELTADELTRLRQWVADAGIRWGLDETDRERAGQPAERVHTWRFGLDRLLLGVAMPDEDDRVIGDVAPYDDMEGDDVELLDRLAQAHADLAAVIVACREPATPATWRDRLDEALRRLVRVDEQDRWRVHEVRRALDDVLAPVVDEPRRLDLGAVKALVEEAVDVPRGAAGYETGAVTVCEMVPMRSIPHRVVCLLGADDDAFPRVQRRPGFDLTAASRRLGDRQRRDEDRFLFLEALMAARDRLVITYSGHDERTNEERAPAVPVAELLDVVARSAGVPVDEARRELTRHHPLQPFSPRAFGVDADGAPQPARSFDRAQLAAAEALHAGRPADGRPFVAERLPAPEVDELGPVRVDQLASALTDPSRALCQRLGLRLDEDVVTVSDVEPVETDGLERYRLGSRLLDLRLHGGDEDAWWRAEQARGTVPVGAFGEQARTTVTDVVEELLDVAGDGLEAPAERVPIDLAIGDHRLVDELDGLRDGTWLRTTYARVADHHRLQLWVQHLALHATGRLVTSRLVGRGSSGKARPRVVELPPLADDVEAARDEAVQRLQRLLDLRLEGLQRPLPLFKRASGAYASSWHKAAGETADADEAAEQRARHAALKAWMSDEHASGDDVDPYVVQVWGEHADLEDILERTDFASLALTCYQPLLEREVGR